MARLVLDGSGDTGDLPFGEVLTARIASVQDVEKPWNSKKTGEPQRMFAFEFDITDARYAGRKTWMDVWPEFFPSDRCQLYKWTLAVLNEESLPEGFVLDTDLFVGVDCYIELFERRYKKRDGTEAVATDVTLLTKDEATSLMASMSSAPPAATVQGIQGLTPVDSEEPF